MYLFNLDFDFMDGRTLDLLLVPRWLLNGSLDEDDGLSVDPLDPAHHVLRDSHIVFGENTLYRRHLVPEYDEDNLGAYRTA